MGLGSEGWSIARAEELLSSLAGVLAARIVARPGGEVAEIHILSSDDVNPKQTVRNVESALLSEFRVSVDHRRISVAQVRRPPEPGGAARLRAVAGGGETPERGPEPEPSARPAAPARPTATDASLGPVAEPRPPAGAAPPSQLPRAPWVPDVDTLEVAGFRVWSDRGQRIEVSVTLEWAGQIHEGTASGTDLARSRLDTFANATLRALEDLLRARGGAEAGRAPTLTLDGVTVLEAFGRRSVMVAVHAVDGREVVTLTGTEPAGHGLERSVILAVLQATERWVRGRVSRNPNERWIPSGLQAKSERISGASRLT